MIEIRPLYSRTWEPSEPLVAYNKADKRVVIASAMSRGNNSYYDRYGYKGSQDIVCIDCLEAGQDVPVSLVVAETRCIHFRHKAGEAPEGMRRHGETTEHLHGKQLIVDWAREQHHILPWSIDDEVWVPGARLRSDVKAELVGGRQLAFEVQRKPLEWKDWDRRHGGYTNAGVVDVWLWSPDVPHLVLDLPLTSVVMDMEHEEIGVLVANYGGDYRHPTAERHLLGPTHYAAAPLAEWSISASGSLVPPPEMAEYIGDKPESARVAQLRTHREGAPKQSPTPRSFTPKPLHRPPAEAPGAEDASSGQFVWVDSRWGPVAVRSAPRRDPEREADREAEAIARIFGRKG
jgi:hypothetical protein